MISPFFLATIGWEGYAFALLVLLLARPIALGASLLGAPLSWKEWLTVLWFGPRGFASVFYGLFVLKSGVGPAWEVFHLVGLVIAFSMVAHSSTDTLVARWFRQEGAGVLPQEGEDRFDGWGGADDRPCAAWPGQARSL